MAILLKYSSFILVYFAVDKSGVDSTTGDGESQLCDSNVLSPEVCVQDNTEVIAPCASSADCDDKSSDQQSTKEGSTCAAGEDCNPGLASDKTLKKPMLMPRMAVSNPTSPVHSIRVPVTDCEPLGVFSDPLSVSTDSCHKVATSADSDRAKAGSVARRNLLIDLEPFGATARTRSAAGRVGVEGHTGVEGHELRKTCSTGKLLVESYNSSDASSPGSPVEAWSPMSSGHGPMPDSIPSPPMTNRASTLPAKTNLSSLPQDNKSVGRSESFSSAFRSAASVFASKFTELKQSMSTPTSATRGSSQSLSARPAKLHETETLLSESDEDRLLARASSNDCLSSGTLQTSVSSNKSSSSSVTGTSSEDIAVPVQVAVTSRHAHKPFGRCPCCMHRYVVRALGFLIFVIPKT